MRASCTKMNAPGGSRYLRAGHFTTSVEDAMHEQCTNPARSKEEICLDAIAAGFVSVDEQGQVWKHKRRRSGGSIEEYNPPLRADHADKIGYCRLGVRVGGKQHIVYAHRLVWVCHNGRIPDGLEVNHKDGNKSNNSLANLELVTRGENLKHAFHVLKVNTAFASLSPSRKLTADRVCKLRAARRERKPAPSYGQLGVEFGVSSITARSICLGLTWKGLVS